MKQKIYWLDYLRVFGAFSVLMYHYSFRGVVIDGVKQPLFPYLELVFKYGYLGVNLFFMISGFVILMSATSKSATDFAIARVDRLFPAYWAAVTFTAICLIVFSWEEVTLTQYIFNLTMLNDYFDIKDIDGVYWTLHAELKFYFIIFLLILSRQVGRVEVWLISWVLVVLLYAFTGVPSFLGCLISPTYSAYFIAGISFFMIKENKKNLLYYCTGCSSLFLALYHAPGQLGGFIPNHTRLDVYLVLIIVFTLYVVFFLFAVDIIRISKQWLYIAKLSSLTYLIYLIHAGIGKNVFDFLTDYLPNYVNLLLVMFLIVAIAELLHFSVEKKMAGKIRGWSRL